MTPASNFWGPGDSSRAFMMLTWLLSFSLGNSLEILDLKAKDANTLLLYMHIPMTGGSSLIKEAPEKFDLQHCILPQEYLYPFTQAISSVDYSTCNFLSFEGGNWMLKHLPAQQQVRTMSLFRNPLELRISGLEAHSKHPGEDPHDILKNFEEGLDYEGYHLQDYQIKSLLCGTDETATERFVPCEYNIEDAPAAIDKLWWVGITEYYKESLCILAYQLGVFDKQACNCKRADDGVHNPEPYTEHGGSYTVEQIKMLSEVNRGDLLLYGLAVARFLQDAEAIYSATGVKIVC